MKIKAAAPPTISYHAIKGSYGKVIYFMAKAGLRDVAENLELAPQESLNFSERIQRKINITRVERELLPYLQTNELRFFNSIVCIMLPDKERNSGFWEFEEYHDDGGNPLGGLGLLRISKDVGRIVLDGQHRYEALKQYWKSIKDSAEASAHQIEVALLFIVVEERGKLGVAAPTNLRRRILEDGRNLFAVLNKTAVSVDRNTLLLIDDTDIRNVITRKLLEDKVIDDLHVKWIGALNLNPTDPYFTAIQVIQDLVIHYLADIEEVEKEYGTSEERKDALEKLYHHTSNTGVPLVEFARKIIADGGALKRWEKHLKDLKINLITQPKETTLNATQRKAISDERNKELIFTIAGQKAAFRATIDAFYSGAVRTPQRLNAITKHVDEIFSKGLYRRNVLDEKNPFRRVLFDLKGRMSPSEASVDLARKILSVSLGSGLDQDSVLKEYSAYTDYQQSVVKEYWEATRKK